MSDNYNQAPVPAPSRGPAGEVEPWYMKLPTDRQEFEYTGDNSSLPDWLEGMGGGPGTLRVPMGSPDHEGPYATQVVRAGDTVVFLPPEGAYPARFDVLKGDVDLGAGGSTVKPPQMSGASLEDLIRGGTLKVENLSPDAKAQVKARSPRVARYHDITDETIPQEATPKAGLESMMPED